MDYLKFKPNYDELITYYEDTHPHKEIEVDGAAKKVKFSIFDIVGSLICCQNTYGVTVMAQKLGLGPSLFLMSTKAIAYLFLVLSIFNLPVMLLFSAGSSS